MMSAFFLFLILSTALLFGNEFSVGFFIHPSLSRIDDRAFLPAIQVFAGYDASGRHKECLREIVPGTT
jgi:hypothetical protein